MTPCLRWGALACALVSGCAAQAGVDPPAGQLNFPIALALSRPAGEGAAARFLYVANSNFDLRYSHGTLMAIDLDVAHELIASDPECGGDDACTIEDLGAIRTHEVAIGSHTDGMAVSPSGGRLYLAVRSDRNLTFVDVNDGRFECGSEGATSTGVDICGASHRSGDEGGVASDRQLTLSGDPIAVATGSLTAIGADEGTAGDFVVLAMREGRVALFVDQAGGGSSTPELVHVAEGFPENLVSMTVQPGTGIAWLTSAGNAELGRAAISLDRANPNRSFVYDFGSLPLAGLDDGRDARDIQFHPDGGEAFVLTRRPEAVVTLELEGQTDADLGDLYEVGAGPSRIAVGRIADRTYVFASCFDARKLFVIDADLGALVSTVGGFSGPFEIVVDDARRMLYLADFSTSVIRVIDLAPLADGLSPEHIATLGTLVPVESFVN